jgi:hypothetical protein
MDQHFAKIECDLTRLTWMVAFNLAATVGVIFMVLA